MFATEQSIFKHDSVSPNGAVCGMWVLKKQRTIKAPCWLYHPDKSKSNGMWVLVSEFEVKWSVWKWNFLVLIAKSHYKCI